MREDLDDRGLDVRVTELLVATADASDPQLHAAIGQVLALLRERLGMDVVYVGQFVGDRRVYRFVDQAPGRHVIEAGQSDPLEVSWCQRVVDGRLACLETDMRARVAKGEAPPMPYEVGTFVSVPLVMPDGRIAGTLCCLSHGVQPRATGKTLSHLRHAAKLIAQRLAEHGQA